MGSTWVCHEEPVSKRQTMKWKQTDSLVKKKFQAQGSVKKIMLIVFWDMKGSISIELLEKDATINIASYCKLLWQYLPHSLNEPCISEFYLIDAIIN